VIAARVNNDTSDLERTIATIAPASNPSMGWLARAICRTMTRG
jgi:hypothetical protein